MEQSDPFIVAPTLLVEARAYCHAACQWPSKAARANLAAAADDSHSNLGWNNEYSALVSRPLNETGWLQLGFSFATQQLIWLVNGKLEDELSLVDTTGDTTQAWVDAYLERESLRPTVGVDMPYSLDAPLPNSSFGQLLAETQTLGAWYGFGVAAMERLIERHPVAIGKPLVRCWPHHFDLGALMMLEEGDPETARSVGLGMSPGDGSHEQPYFYCSPWPVSEDVKLPPIEGPFRWHTQGFTSAVLTAEGVATTEDVDGALLNAMQAVLALLDEPLH